MNIANILAGLEKLVVEVLLWLLFIPKTLLKIVSDPDWAPGYVDAELAKDKARFEDYMSPVPLFLICSVVLFVVGDIVIWSDSGASGAEAVKKTMSNLQGVSGYTAALGFLSLPLLFSLGSVLFRGDAITRKSIERILYIQCFYFSPLTLSVMGVALYETSPDLQVYMALTLVPFALWFSVIEIRLFAHERQIGWLRSIGVFTSCIFAALLLGTIAILLSMDTVSHDAEEEGGREEFTFTLPETDDYEIYISDYYEPQATSILAKVEVLLNGETASCSSGQTFLPYSCELKGQEKDILVVTAQPGPELDIVLELKRNGVVEPEGYIEGFMAFLGALYVIAIVIAMAKGFRSLFRRTAEG
jgi:hypothetical protein